MNAQELMTKEPLSIPADASANDAMLIMAQNDVRHLPVIDREGRVVGILSDRDLLQLPRPQFAGAPLTGSLKTPLSNAVNAFMSRQVFSVTPDVDVRNVIDLMLEHRLDAVPVVDATRHLLGLVSSSDILKQSRSVL